MRLQESFKNLLKNPSLIKIVKSKRAIEIKTECQANFREGNFQISVRFFLSTFLSIDC